MIGGVRREVFYQIRVERGETMDDVVTHLTQVVWGALKDTEGLKGADPHRWPDLYLGFLSVLKKRVFLYEGCGRQEECRLSIGVYGPLREHDIPSGPTHILALRGGVGLVRGLPGGHGLAAVPPGTGPVYSPKASFKGSAAERPA